MTQLALEPAPVLVTIPNVELVTVGQWNASTGPAEFTVEDLEAIVAALDDPAIHDPRLRIGHTAPSASPDESAGGFADQPAFGRFTNLRLNATRTSIVADAVGVPAWLAEILPSAFPSRSVEVYWNVTTAVGRTHRAVMTSVALLGVSMPAVETLEDLQLAFGAEPPEGVQFTYDDRVVASKGEPMPNGRVAAAVTYTDVRRSFYEEIAQGDRYWWFICDVIMSPATVIADDDEDGYWAVPYTLTADGVIWGDPVEVKIQYVEVESGKVAASKPTELDGVRAEYVSAAGERLAAAAPAFTAAESRPSDRVRAAVPPKGEQMNEQQKQLALKLGLGEDATEEQLNAKLQADALAAADTDPDPDTDPEAPEADAAVAPTALQVAPDALAQLQEDARLGREARQAQLQAEREHLVDARIEAGCITPASRGAHLAELAKGGEIEKAHRAYLSGLAEGVIPVRERGAAPADASNGDGGRLPFETVMASFGSGKRQLTTTGKEQ